MRIPPSVNIVVLAVVATALYTMVGQMVPQKEVPAPEVILISKDATTEEMIEIGKPPRFVDKYAPVYIPKPADHTPIPNDIISRVGPCIVRGLFEKKLSKTSLR